jgi:hypothetical protein
MTTLTQPTLSILLDRLFAESDALEDVFRREMESLSPEQRAADRADYRQFYARLKDHPLPISRTTGPERRISILPYSPCLRAACVPVLLLLRITRMLVRSILPASGLRRTAIYRSRLPTTSNCRCD